MTISPGSARPSPGADRTSWNCCGIADLEVQSDPLKIATEGGLHALCWVHSERLVHKLNPVTEAQQRARAKIQQRFWRLYADLLAYKAEPKRRPRSQLERRFDALFTTRTGYRTMDRLLARLYANKQELLVVVDRPEVPLHTNGTENDVRC